MFGKSKVTKQQIAIIYKSKYFDPQWYLEQNADINRKKLDPALHYLKHGWKEHRAPSKEFDIDEYKQQYPECKICPLLFEHNRNENVYLSIVAIMKNEAPYVKEWIEYHLLVGVDRFYIYDNESTDNLKDVLQPYIETGIVIYTYWPGRKEEGIQPAAYNDAVQKFKEKTFWMSPIDADEFIVPLQDKNLKEFLQKYERYVGVVINWQMYDYDGNQHEPHGSVLANYLRTHNFYQHHSDTIIKTVFNPRMIKTCDIHDHIYKNEARPVDENFAIHQKFGYTLKQNIKKIKINHYFSKSADHYREKVMIGRQFGRAGNQLDFTKKQYCFECYKYDNLMIKYALILDWKNIFTIIKKLIIHVFSVHPRMVAKEYFDKKWYIKNYKKELEESKLSPIEHYINIGWKLGYNPGPKFDTMFYLTMYPDVKNENLCPLLHYDRYGKYEGRIPNLKNYLEKSKLFNEKWYKKTYKITKESAENHYFNEGWKLGYNPSKYFDTNAYLEAYPDIKKANMCPLYHYLNWGKKEGRKAFPVKSR